MCGNAELAAVELLKLVIAAEDIQLGLKGPNPKNRAGREWLFRNYRICLHVVNGGAMTESGSIVNRIRARVAQRAVGNVGPAED